MNANEHEWMPTAGLVLMRSTIRVYSSPFADLKMVFICFYSRMKKMEKPPMNANERELGLTADTGLMHCIISVHSRAFAVNKNGATANERQ